MPLVEGGVHILWPSDVASKTIVGPNSLCAALEAPNLSDARERGPELTEKYETHPRAE